MRWDRRGGTGQSDSHHSLSVKERENVPKSHHTTSTCCRVLHDGKTNYSEIRILIDFNWDILVFYNIPIFYSLSLLRVKF